MQVMKLEKTKPVGKGLKRFKMEERAHLRLPFKACSMLGTHMKTKEYLKKRPYVTARTPSQRTWSPQTKSSPGPSKRSSCPTRWPQVATPRPKALGLDGGRGVRRAIRLLLALQSYSEMSENALFLA